MKKIGILGFQGAIVEHERQIKAIGHEPVIVKYPGQLEEIDGIILPGGESTTMGKILNRTGLMELLRGKIQGGLPVWCGNDLAGQRTRERFRDSFGRDGYCRSA